MTADAGITGQSRIEVPDTVLSRTAGDEVVLLDLDSEEYFGLDGVGARLWELVDEGVTFEGAVTTLLDEYDVERERLEADLRSVLADLAERGLVRLHAP